MNILYLLPFSFIPPTSGNKNLTFNLLKYMTKNAKCDLILLLENDADDATIKKSIIAELPEVGQIWIFRRPKAIQKILAKIKFACQGYHPALGSYHSQQLVNWLKVFAQQNDYDLIHFDMFYMAIYQKYFTSIPSLLVASDAYSMSMYRSKLGSNSLLEQFSWFLQEWLMRNFEKTEYEKFSAVCTVSLEDTKYLQNICLKDNLKTIGIAIGEEYIAEPQRSFSKPAQIQPNILCTGAISVPVAANGVSQFLQKSYPLIINKIPQTKLTLLGRNIDQGLKKQIDKINSVFHIEYVPNYPEFLRQDWIYIYPQRCGSGLQTKVQQAMAVGLPVVGFQEAFGGLNVENGIHCFQCQTYDDFREAVISLMSDRELRQKIGYAASEHIRRNFSIEKVGQDVYQLYLDLAKQSI